MRLKEYSLSLPSTYVVGAVAPMADGEDVVLSVTKCASLKGLLRLTLRNKNGREDTAAFLVPESLQEHIIFSILRKENMTLREVGELPITETAFVEPVSIASQTEPAASWAEFFSSIADALRQRPGRVIIKRQRRGRVIFKLAHSILLFFRLG